MQNDSRPGQQRASCSGSVIASCLLLLLALGGCLQAPAPPPLPTGAPEDFPAQRYGAKAAGKVMTISASELTIKVYRGGRLKHLGHNHVLTSQALDGLIMRASNDTLAGSYADLYLPLASLQVDDPIARAQAGEDFSSQPSAADRRGTLGNLLGPRLLEAERYPYLRAAITLTEVQPGELVAQVALTVKAQTLMLSVPVQLRRSANALSLASQFQVSHAQLGLTPFSVLGGAITVADPIHVQLTLDAETD